MAPDLLSARLKLEQRRKLTDIAEARGTSVAAALNLIIDEAYEEMLRRGRLRAVEELGRLQVEDMPDAGTLSRRLADTYAVDLP